MRRSILTAASVLLLIGGSPGSFGVAAAAKPPPPPGPCDVEGACIPWLEEIEEPVIQQVVGREVDAYHWKYSATWSYGYIDSSGSHHVGDITLVATIGLNGRESQWVQKSSVLDGPAIRAHHVWECRDRNDILPSHSCSNDEQHRENTVYQKSIFKSTDFNYDPSNNFFFYQFEFWWMASGYSPIIWETGRMMSTDYECRGDPDATNPCRFFW